MLSYVHKRKSEIDGTAYASLAEGLRIHSVEMSEEAIKETLDAAIKRTTGGKSNLLNLYMTKHDRPGGFKRAELPRAMTLHVKCDESVLDTQCDLVDVFNAMASVRKTSMAGCTSLRIMTNMLSSHKTLAEFNELIFPKHTTSTDIQVAAARDAIYIETFGNGITDFELSGIDSDPDHPDFNSGIYHVIKGLCFAKHSLTTLVLTGVSLGMDAQINKETTKVSMLATLFLRNNRTIRYVDLSDNKLNDADIDVLTTHMATTAIQTFDISLNRDLTMVSLSHIAERCSLRELVAVGCTNMVIFDNEVFVSNMIVKMKKKFADELVHVNMSGIRIPTKELALLVGKSEDVPVSVTAELVDRGTIVVASKLVPLLDDILMAGKTKQIEDDACKISWSSRDRAIAPSRVAFHGLWDELTVTDNGLVAGEQSRMESIVTFLAENEKGAPKRFRLLSRVLFTLINYEGPVTVKKKKKNKEGETSEIDVETDCVLVASFDRSDFSISDCDIPDEAEQKKKSREIFNAVYDACRQCGITPNFVNISEYNEIKRNKQ